MHDNTKALSIARQILCHHTIYGNCPAWLYGSRARGQAGQRSDWDIAVVCEDWKGVRRESLTTEYGDIDLIAFGSQAVAERYLEQTNYSLIIPQTHKGVESWQE
jgi:hypothetical protein